jgi:hypothetical protein
MSANASKTKYIIFHKKGILINKTGLEFVYNDNEPDDLNNISNIHTLERIHSKNPEISACSDKLLGIFIDENLTFNHHYHYTH